MRIARESVEEPAEVLVQHRVRADLVLEIVERVGRRQFAVDEQVRRLEERRLLGELLDRVPAVAQDAGVTVDVGDRRRARRRVGEAGVVGDQTGARQQLADVGSSGSLGRHAGGLGTVSPFPTGVWVDTQGVLRPLLHDRPRLLRSYRLPAAT